MSSFSKRIYNLCKKNEKNEIIIATSIFGQFGQNLYQNMRKDFKYAQRPQAAFGHTKDPGAASGRLKVAFS